MNLTEQREAAAQAALSGYEWPGETAGVPLAFSASACGEKLVCPVLIEAELGQFEVSFEPDSADISASAAWLNGEQVGSNPGSAALHP